MAGVAATMVAVVAVAGMRWRADRAYVGTDTAAELSWGQCLNGIGWKDPSNGVGWYAGHDIVVTGQYESETVRIRNLQPDDPTAPPIRTIVHSSVGSVHFDSYDRATFTSRTGGTMLLTRVPAGGMAVTADCVGGGDAPQQQPRTSLVVWGQISGVLGHRAPAGDDLLLAKGTIHVGLDGVEVESIPITGRGPFAVNVPVGTVTIRGAYERGDCGSVTVAVAAGDHVDGDLLCDRP